MDEGKFVVVGILDSSGSNDVECLEGCASLEDGRETVSGGFEDGVSAQWGRKQSE